MIRKQEFYIRLKTFFQSSLEFFANRQDQAEPEHRLVEQPEFSSNGGIRVRTIVRQRLDISSEDCEMLQALPEFGDLVSFIAGSELAQDLLVGVNGELIDESKHAGWLFQYLLLPLFSRYSQKVDRLEFRQGVFDELYRGIEHYCACSNITIVSVAPIFGFALTTDVELPVRLDSSLVVRELDAQERSMLWQSAADSTFYQRFDLHRLRFAAEYTQQVDKRHPSYLISSEPFELLEDLLRLIKRHPVTIRFLNTKITPWYNNRVLIGGTLSWPRSGLAGHRFIHPVLLEPKDARLLQQLWQAWPSVEDKDGRFALATRYFASSYDKVGPQAKLIDLWVGLELLFPDVLHAKRGASQRRLNAVTEFLNLDTRGSRQIRRNLRNSYELRSDIVHGDVPYRHDLNNLTPETEDILAKSLLECLAQLTLP